MVTGIMPGYFIWLCNSRKIFTRLSHLSLSPLKTWQNVPKHNPKTRTHRSDNTDTSACKPCYDTAISNGQTAIPQSASLEVPGNPEKAKLIHANVDETCCQHILLTTQRVSSFRMEYDAPGAKLGYN